MEDFFIKGRGFSLRKGYIIHMLHVRLSDTLKTGKSREKRSMTKKSSSEIFGVKL